MRGWSSIMVLYFHIAAQLPIVASRLFLYSGYSGVYFFFLISGYILTRKLDSEDYKSGNKFNALMYYLRRIFRIWPLYFISIPLFALTQGMPIIWQDFLFIQNYNPATFVWNPLWTLVIEELFYLILPLWTFAFKKNWQLSLVGIMLLSFGYTIFIPSLVPLYLVSILLCTVSHICDVLCAWHYTRTW